MHQTYRTEAIVLEMRNSGEANRFVYFFTKEFGLVGGQMQGVRTIASKQRLHIGLFSVVQVSLVRGREVWRVTNSIVKDQLGSRVAHNPDALMRMARIASTIRRLVHGEECNVPLYDVCRDGFIALAEPGERQELHAPSIEWITVARILHILGYMGNEPMLRPFFETTGLNEQLFKDANTHARPLVSAINRSLKESQL